MKFYPFFDNCDGALNGTHIPAVIPLIDQGVYRNRKKIIFQNVLGVCNFGMIFTYVLTGWEGSAHNGTVLANAKLSVRILMDENKSLPISSICYFLGLIFDRETGADLTESSSEKTKSSEKSRELERYVFLVVEGPAVNDDLGVAEV